MPQTALTGNGHQFGGKEPGVTRRAVAHMVGLATLIACAPLPLISEALAQTSMGGATIEPMALPDMALGPGDPPVTIVDYSSMTCSHCAAFMINVFPMLRSKYIDSGRVRFVFREFPLDNKAAAATMLARYIAGGDSARYFGAIDVLFRQQDQLIAQPNDTLYRVGRHYGVSQEEVESCLRNQSLLDQIKKTQKIASEVAMVKATPTFVINGEKSEGFIPYEAIDSKIASLLRR